MVGIYYNSTKEQNIGLSQNSSGFEVELSSISWLLDLREYTTR